ILLSSLGGWFLRVECCRRRDGVAAGGRSLALSGTECQGQIRRSTMGPRKVRCICAIYDCPNAETPEFAGGEGVRRIPRWETVGAELTDLHGARGHPSLPVSHLCQSSIL